jgi:hypothetical protein
MARPLWPTLPHRDPRVPLVPALVSCCRIDVGGAVIAEDSEARRNTLDALRVQARDLSTTALRNSIELEEARYHNTQRRLIIVSAELLILTGLFYLSKAFATNYEDFGLNRAQGNWVSFTIFILGLLGAVPAYWFAEKRLPKAAPSTVSAPSRADAETTATNDALIAAYHQLTTRQSASSFRNSQIAMGVGLAILVTGAIAVIRATDPTGRIILGALTGLGSTFSGYLGATFLRAHDRALQQVNYLFSQPLVSHYLEYSRRVASELSSTDLRDNALSLVVDRGLESAGVAAMIPAPSGEKSTPRVARQQAEAANPHPS